MFFIEYVEKELNWIERQIVYKIYVDKKPKKAIIKELGVSETTYNRHRNKIQSCIEEKRRNDFNLQK